MKWVMDFGLEHIQSNLPTSFANSRFDMFVSTKKYLVVEFGVNSKSIAMSWTSKASTSSPTNSMPLPSFFAKFQTPLFLFV